MAGRLIWDKFGSALLLPLTGDANFVSALQAKIIKLNQLMNQSPDPNLPKNHQQRDLPKSMEVRTDLPSFQRWRQERRYVLQAHKPTELHLKSTRENHIR